MRWFVNNTDAAVTRPGAVLRGPMRGGKDTYLRDTLRRLLAGEKDLSVVLPESYAARVKAAAATAAAAA